MTSDTDARPLAGFLGSDVRSEAHSTGLGRAWADYRAYRRTLGELTALTEKQLADIGMRRDALRAITSAAVYGN